MLDALLGALFISILFIILYLEYDERISRQSALDLAHRLQSQLCTSSFTFPISTILKYIVFLVIIIIGITSLYYGFTTLSDPITDISEYKDIIDASIAKQQYNVPIKKREYVDILKYYPPSYLFVPYDYVLSKDNNATNIFKDTELKQQLGIPDDMHKYPYDFAITRVVNYNMYGSNFYNINPNDSTLIQAFKKVIWELVLMGQGRTGYGFSGIEPYWSRLTKLFIDTSYAILPKYHSNSMGLIVLFFKYPRERDFLILYVDWYHVVMKIHLYNMTDDEIEQELKQYIDMYQIRLLNE